MSLLPLRSSSLLLVLLLSAGSATLCAQIPTKCLELESILVDACNPSDICPNSSEGQNEMVRFRTGPAPIAISDIEADWPNGQWRGLVQNATTAQLTITLNTSITSCGWLVEPPNGIIPAGKPVLMITSTAMCTAANSFANLGDTLYLVFQAPGNTAGHFANHTNGGTPSPTPSGGSELRTLILFHLPTNCSDTASYDRELLVNNVGTYGGPGPTNDGATAQFSWPGVPAVTYVNFGCQAPVSPVSLEAIVVNGDLCGGNTVELAAVVQGGLDQLQWSGGSGVFSDPTGTNTTYTPGPSDVGSVVLQVCGEGVCASALCATITLPVGDAPSVSISADGPLTLCPGESVTLTATGADDYVWSNASTASVITVTQAGTYSVQGSNACGNSSATVTVTAAPGPNVSVAGDLTFCAGGSTTLTANGADDYVWSTSATDVTIEVTTAGSYTVTGTNSCGSASSTVQVVELPQPMAAITGDTVLCGTDPVVLSASGGTSYVWSTGSTQPSITVNTPGTISVVATNACGTSTAQVNVVNGPVVASFTPSVLSGIAPVSVGFANTSTPAGASMSWDFGDGAQSQLFAPVHIFQTPGVYEVTLVVEEQGCTSIAQVTIVVLAPEVAVSTVEVPNVFTPNGDGMNDALGLIQFGLSSVDMEILNRWGQVVARIERPNDLWSGRSFSGEPLAEGTYFYVLEARGLDGRQHALQGSITLLR